jgi:hypothetical protein
VARPVAPPPQDSVRRPVRVEPVPGTGYGLAIVGAPAATSGPSVGALLAGIASILVSLLVSCFGLVELSATDDGQRGTGVLVGGAFAVLAGFLGCAGIGLGVAGMRQTKRGAGGPPVAGRGMAIAGLVCGAVGLGIAVCAIGVAGLAALA